MWNSVVGADDVQAMAASACSVENCGNILAWTSFTTDNVKGDVAETTLQCKSRIEDCKTGEFDGKALDMESTDGLQYAQSFQLIPDLREFTMCSWVRSTDTSASKYLVSYRSSNINTGSFYVKNPNSVQMAVNNQAGVASGIAVNYGIWHHLCMTWDSDDTGRYHYYKDGNMRYTYYNLRSGQTILGGGTLIIGQWQASVGGGLNKVYAFNHEVTEFNIWSELLDDDRISVSYPF
ncbi:neuronal pentraxin-2-like [Glandiceps talaboti]